MREAPTAWPVRIMSGAVRVVADNASMVGTPDLPSIPDLLYPTLQALNALGGSGTIHAIVEKVIERGGFTEEQLAIPHLGGPSSDLQHRLAWARSWLLAVGAVENSSRGVWSITDKGRELTLADMAGVEASLRALQLQPPAGGHQVQPGGEPPRELRDAAVKLSRGALRRLAGRLLR